MYMQQCLSHVQIFIYPFDLGQRHIDVNCLAQNLFEVDQPAWSCQNVCDALTFLLDNIFIRFGTKLYRQVVGIPMGTSCAPPPPPWLHIYSCFVMRGTL